MKSNTTAAERGAMLAKHVTSQRQKQSGMVKVDKPNRQQRRAAKRATPKVAVATPDVAPADLPEPDFTLDGGSVRCYYESTVRRLIAAELAGGVPASSLQPSELATHEVATPPTGVPAQGDAEDDEDQRELESIGRAVNRAATDLPLGARLQIDLERDAGSVCWLDRGKGARRTIEGAGEFFSNQIHAAIDAAMAQGKEGES